MRKWLLWIGLGLPAVTALPVLVLRFVPPPTSAYMLERRLQFALAGRPHPPIRYRWVPLRDISPALQLAVVAAEDQTFPDNWGFDFDAIAEAWHFNRTHRRTHGASTITQQTARNLFLWPSRTWLRKGLETYYAVLLETLWPKRRILEVYLNIAEFGDGIYGAQAAATIYFRRPAARLDEWQAALLAAALPAPRRRHPGRPSPYLLGRAAEIEQQMRDLGADHLQRLDR
ncbi:MAG: monofunctional biosynthetic peptidoglycan transglycosylase [Gammaproteobacteria bacterium]|nr:monofunctional biosynthetic peptidoglycan transglycosylase [Gammaproteobacteria bacterium]